MIREYDILNINVQQLILYIVVRVKVQGGGGEVVELVAIANYNKNNHCIVR